MWNDQNENCEFVGAWNFMIFKNFSMHRELCNCTSTVEWVSVKYSEKCDRFFKRKKISTICLKRILKKTNLSDNPWITHPFLPIFQPPLQQDNLKKNYLVTSGMEVE